MHRLLGPQDGMTNPQRHRFDAFTHKPTAQYSLAFEKASVIFNISAVLTSFAAVQNRENDSGLKAAYHSFQAAAGMFTYINDNFLHAPSTDLSRETVKTLVHVSLAQAQEIFLEKQIADKKKDGLIAKLASQAAFLYSQALEGVQENVSKVIFERVWLLLVQIKLQMMNSVAQYYQAVADNDANAFGVSIGRLQLAETSAKEALKFANSFPSSVPANSNLPSDTGAITVELTKRHLALIQERKAEFIKDNDFIYHQPVPNEATLPSIPKSPAAKPIPVTELYTGRDLHQVIGPDIFQKIVPLSVTESASMYDEEKAKLIRAEAERLDLADGEMLAVLDYLKLPGSLKVLKGGSSADQVVEDDFVDWCREMASQPPLDGVFDELKQDKSSVVSSLDRSSRQLDMEESVCEKMRSKYGAEWTQQPSSRLTTTLRGDIKSYREAIEQATNSDGQLFGSFRQYESEFETMRAAGEVDEADVLFRKALVRAGAKGKGRSNSSAAANSLLDDDFREGQPSIAEQTAQIEQLIGRLNLIKRDRQQVLKDLKEKVSCCMTSSSAQTETNHTQVHNDDISNVLILNKKANQDSQLFQSELEKFKPYQSRISQAYHKQTTTLNELTAIYNRLLSDNRVQAEQSQFENIVRQRQTVMSKHRKIFQAFRNLITGLNKAQQFYSEMKDTVESLEKNVDTFVNNRRSEGAQLLTQTEHNKESRNSGQAEQEQQRMREILARMTMDPSSSPGRPDNRAPQNRPNPLNLKSNSRSDLQQSPPGYSGGQYPQTAGPQQTTFPISYQNGNGQRPVSHQVPAQTHDLYNPSYLQRPLRSPPPDGQQGYDPAFYQASQSQPQRQQQPATRYASPPTAPGQDQRYHASPPNPAQELSAPHRRYPPPPEREGQSDRPLVSPGMKPNGPGGYAGTAPRRPSQARDGNANAGNDPWGGLQRWQ